MSALIPHFLGSFASDAACSSFVASNGWFPERTASSATPCTSLVPGLMYRNTTSGLLRYYDGTAWRAVGSSGGVSVTPSRDVVLMESTPQAIPADADGDIYVNMTDGNDCVATLPSGVDPGWSITFVNNPPSALNTVVVTPALHSFIGQLAGISLYLGEPEQAVEVAYLGDGLWAVVDCYVPSIDLLTFGGLQD